LAWYLPLGNDRFSPIRFRRRGSQRHARGRTHPNNENTAAGCWI